MMSESNELLSDHSYDGIQEYDNPLPGWWTWLFVGTVLFSVGYWAFYESGTKGRSIHEQYDRAVAENLRIQFSEIGELEPTRETIVRYMNDEKWLKVGQIVYQTHCVSCHGTIGQGNVGPNLTDDHWKNVTQVEDIAKVISDGAANGAMPAWKHRLGHINEIVLTAAYVASLRGSSPASGKKAEGNRIEPWPALSSLKQPDPSVSEGVRPASTSQ